MLPSSKTDRVCSHLDIQSELTFSKRLAKGSKMNLVALWFDILADVLHRDHIKH